jgi:AraC-like DNA-binding protein
MDDERASLDVRDGETVKARCGRQTAAEIRLILERQYDQRVTLHDLAGTLGLSPFRILRLFQRHCGVTPHKYLVQLRVREASKLLLDGQPIAEVAAQVGFVDQSHMTKHFKRQFGVTPCRYRSVNESIGTAAAQCPVLNKEPVKVAAQGGEGGVAGSRRIERICSEPKYRRTAQFATHSASHGPSALKTARITP